MKSPRLAVQAALVLALAPGACEDGVGTTGPSQAGEPHAIVPVNGDQQQGVVGMPLPERVVVRVIDVAGRGVPGVPVEFSVALGGGWVTPEGEHITDEHGRAGATWYMGPRPSQDAVIVRARSPVGTTGFRAYAAPLLAGTTYRGADELTELRVGDLPLILTAGHGGTAAPPGIADRVEGERSPDPHTLELVEALEAQLGARPTVVVSHLARRKADVNVPMADATSGSPGAERAWREYHGFLAAVRARLQDSGARGLIVDLHGHDGPEVIQLGYRLTGEELTLSDAEMDALQLWQKSSIRELVHSNTPPFSYIVRSGSSLGGILEARGLAATPAPSRRSPGPATYEPGGYTVETHGSRGGGLVSALAVQVPAPLRETARARAELVGHLVDALEAFSAAFYGGELMEAVQR